MCVKGVYKVKVQGYLHRYHQEVFSSSYISDCVRLCATDEALILLTGWCWNTLVQTYAVRLSPCCLLSEHASFLWQIPADRHAQTITQNSGQSLHLCSLSSPHEHLTDNILETRRFHNANWTLTSQILKCKFVMVLSFFFILSYDLIILLIKYSND